MIVDYTGLIQDDVDNLRRANNALAESKPGSEEYEAALKASETLTKKIQNVDRQLAEEELERIKLEMESIQYEKERKDGWIKFGVTTGVGIGGTLGGWWFYDKMREKHQQFETTNTPSSTLFRNFLNKLPFNIGKK